MLKSRNLLIEGNTFLNNGKPGASPGNEAHHIYAEAIDILYQFNWFGNTRATSRESVSLLLCLLCTDC